MKAEVVSLDIDLLSRFFVEGEDEESGIGGSSHNIYERNRVIGNETRLTSVKRKLNAF